MATSAFFTGFPRILVPANNLWAIHPKNLTIVVARSMKKVTALAAHDGKPLRSQTDEAAKFLDSKLLAKRFKLLV